jgi:alanine racemase
MGNQGAISIGAYTAPLIGRVSMDLITVDVTDIPESLVAPGQWVELLGRVNELEQWATLAQTLPYEVLLSLGKRLLRVYS